MDVKKNISKELLDALPIKEIRIGDTVQKVRFDAMTSRMYLLDQNGDYTGKSAVWTQPIVETEPASGSQDDIDTVPLEIPLVEADSVPELQEEVEPEPQDNEDNETDLQPKVKRRVPMLLILGIATILLILGIMSVRSFLISAKNQKDKNAVQTDRPTGLATTPSPTNKDPFDATDSGDAEDIEPSDDNMAMIALLVPEKDVMPGESMMGVPITITQVPENEYKILSSITKVYTDKDINAISKMVAAKYIFAGKYLTDSDLTAQYISINPWADLEAGEACITLPVEAASGNVADYLWGNQVNVKITYETPYMLPSFPDAGTADTPDGVFTDSTMVESTLITTYLFRGAVIRDVYNREGESLFAEYERRTMLPDAVLAEYLRARYQNKDGAAVDVPDGISVIVTQEQYEMLAAMDMEEVSIELEVVSGSCENELQRNMYADLQRVGQATQTAMETEANL